MEGMIYIVGMGPGNRGMMTRDAYEAVSAADVIVGYTVYTELMAKIVPGKEFVSTPMRHEIERCRRCFELAEEGRRVALICSGDAGVYGLAAPMLEMAADYPDIDIAVVPGITAANSGAAVLGAPLCHDYCVISLSDLLTPWPVIEKRLRAAVLGDFAIAIYNPSSHKRKDYLKRACTILMNAGAEPGRACGYVENIGREGTAKVCCTLEELWKADVNMFTTVFIGNSQTRVIGGRLVTPRGYVINPHREQPDRETS
ncbi:MAG: precorrin-3B C(17)-methyltransferase [Eubacteriales bacterium]|jgi:precorrin-3B C17-methyltransferase